MVTFSVRQFANEYYYEVLEAGPEQGNRRGCSPTVLLLAVSLVTHGNEAAQAGSALAPEVTTRLVGYQSL